MKKYEIAITLGTILITYTEEVLTIIDFSASTLKPKQRINFMSIVPITLPELLAYKWSNGAVCTEVECIIPFEQFWELYGYKVSKKGSQILWNKLSNADKQNALQGVRKYNSFCSQMNNRWRSKKDPETWLRKEGWRDYEK
ncbi:MAG: hypothetical protein ABL940_08255 [Bacteroidia bacterium]